MPSVLIVFLGLFPLVAWAGPSMCGDTKPQRADLLTHEQWRAVLAETPNGDPVLEEAVALEKAKYKEERPDVGQPIRVEWLQARKLILLGAVKTAVQYHDLSVWLLTATGKAYLTREPKIDEVFQVTSVVDPCGIYIQHVTE
jgi:hypothetical protein